jgi:hypothetical protein
MDQSGEPNHPYIVSGWKTLLFQIWSDQYKDEVYPISRAVGTCIHHKRFFDDELYILVYQGMDEGVDTEKDDDKTRYKQSIFYRVFFAERN